MIVEKKALIYDMIIKHFKDNSIKHVDMTGRGGGLYFFDEALSKELEQKGYDVHYAPKGTKNTNHRPAWYIVIK